MMLSGFAFSVAYLARYVACSAVRDSCYLSLLFAVVLVSLWNEIPFTGPECLFVTFASFLVAVSEGTIAAFSPFDFNSSKHCIIRSDHIYRGNGQ
jgi:hypothetical protein